MPPVKVAKVKTVKQKKGKKKKKDNQRKERKATQTLAIVLGKTPTDKKTKRQKITKDKVQTEENQADAGYRAGKDPRGGGHLPPPSLSTHYYKWMATATTNRIRAKSFFTQSFCPFWY